MSGCRRAVGFTVRPTKMKQKPKLLSGGLTPFYTSYTVSMKWNRKPPPEVLEDVIEDLNDETKLMSNIMLHNIFSN